MTLASSPRRTALDVIRRALNNDSRRLKTASTTSHGEGRINRGMRRAKMIASQIAQRAQKISTTLSKSMSRCLEGSFISRWGRRLKDAAKLVGDLEDHLFVFGAEPQIGVSGSIESNRHFMSDPARMSRQHDDAIGKEYCFGDRMRNKKSGPAVFRAQTQKLFIKPVTGHFVQSRTRFIHQEDLGRAGYG